MAKAKTTTKKATAKKAPATKKVVAKKVDSFDWNNVGENVMRNAETISGNIRANAERIGQRIANLMK